jgi:hypothetical protein
VPKFERSEIPEPTPPPLDRKGGILERVDEPTQAFIATHPELSAKLFFLEGMRPHRTRPTAWYRHFTSDEPHRGYETGLRRWQMMMGVEILITDALGDRIDPASEQFDPVFADQLVQWQEGFPPLAPDFSRTDHAILDTATCGLLDLACEFVPVAPIDDGETQPQPVVASLAAG